MFEKGFFGGLFDFDGNGKLDSLERMLDLGMFVKVMEDAEDKEDEDEEEDEE